MSDSPVCLSSLRKLLSASLCPTTKSLLTELRIECGCVSHEALPLPSLSPYWELLTTQISVAFSETQRYIGLHIVCKKLGTCSTLNEWQSDTLSEYFETCDKIRIVK